ALVKKAFSDESLGGIRLSSANSINIGRLLPQIVYYVYAYVKTAKPGEPMIVSIPSGNFGNMMGALLAMRMGIPFRKIVIATNANDEVPVFLKTGGYRKIVPSRVCISNAMNVGHPSNFARVINLYGGHMDETGMLHQKPDLAAMRRDLFAVSIGEQETRETIRKAWQEHRLLLEPHGAVGWAGLESYLAMESADIPAVSVETAHPAKFPEEIRGILGMEPDIPQSLQGIEDRDEYMLNIENRYDAFRDLLVRTYAS
ncbi:threonine synthase, partial [bacterium]|nr:threonine synthase [bacterium]